jgi:hypothetical protein
MPGVNIAIKPPLSMRSVFMAHPVIERATTTRHSTPPVPRSPQIIDMCLPLGCGGCVYFAQPDALRGSLVFTMREVGGWDDSVMKSRTIGTVSLYGVLSGPTPPLLRHAAVREEGYDEDEDDDDDHEDHDDDDDNHDHDDHDDDPCQVRPHFFFGVPRVWEKMYEAMMAAKASTPLPLRLLSDFLKTVMKAHKLSTQYGEE